MGRKIAGGFFIFLSLVTLGLIISILCGTANEINSSRVVNVLHGQVILFFMSVGLSIELLKKGHNTNVNKSKWYKVRQVFGFIFIYFFMLGLSCISLASDIYVLIITIIGTLIFLIAAIFLLRNHKNRINEKEIESHNNQLNSK